MDTPPISSPFGFPEPIAPERERPGAPLPLKLLVGIEAAHGFYTVAANRLWLRPPDPIYIKHPWIAVVGYVIVWLSFYGLLRGNKVSWCLIQMTGLYTVAIYLPKALSYQFSHRLLSRLYPNSVSWVFIGVEVALFLYLLLPSTRHIFFAKTRENNK